MYDPKSAEASEFINHEEILETLEYAKANKSNRELIQQIIEKAKACKGISHREASLLLECDQDDLNEEMFTLAKQISAAKTTFMPLFVAGLFYFIFNAVVDYIMNRIENRMRYYQ